MPSTSKSRKVRTCTSSLSLVHANKKPDKKMEKKQQSFIWLALGHTHQRVLTVLFVFVGWFQRRKTGFRRRKNRELTKRR